LPSRFPEHHFEFIDPATEINFLEEVEPFKALAAAVTSMDRGQVLNECAGPELLEEIQAVVDEIVRAARKRGVN
jgi:hypothetical protein